MFCLPIYTYPYIILDFGASILTNSLKKDASGALSFQHIPFSYDFNSQIIKFEPKRRKTDDYKFHRDFDDLVQAELIASLGILRCYV